MDSRKINSKQFEWTYFYQNYTTYFKKPSKPTLTLYTKNPCPLCDEALEKLKPFLDQVVLEKIDITAPENRRYWKSYRYDIPVFHLNGKFIMKHRANIDVFNNELKEYYLQVKKETETT
ncbi:glutaredoxin-like protein isoform X1 [Biomphalaria pfeifferi]|uniref:Glutaredoxin-like protein n=1 Tax=Biomphalaria pfeifferi TaxID=112525 RepID=A0AAD8F310_BIOPF|nr:glutaredoxin-like protein isoform X1 [Biomphalaria pfeifferi]